MSTIYILALVVIFLLSWAGVFAKNFDDNFLQRTGLSVLGLGTALRIFAEMAPAHSEEQSRWAMTVGVAVYAVGTAFKVWLHNRSTRK